MSIALQDQLCKHSPGPVSPGHGEGALKLAVPVAELPRLAGVLEGTGTVNVDLAIERWDNAVPLISGTVNASLERRCQRCLETLAEDLDLELRLGVVPPESDLELPAGFETCEAEATTVAQVIEDEILLALPMVAIHDDRSDCGPLAGELDKLSPTTEAEEKRRPFAVLESLKND